MDILSELVYEVTTFNFMIWLLIALTALMVGVPLLIVIRQAVLRRRESAYLYRAGGERGKATIVEFTPTGEIRGGVPEMLIEMDVESPIRPTFRVGKIMTVPLRLLKKLKVGSVVPARIDGTGPDDVELELRNTFGTGRSLISLVVAPALFTLFFWAVFGYIFAFSMKGTREYRCAVNFALNSPEVREALGDDVSAGNLAWISSYESGGGVATAYFRVLLKGSKGFGNLYINSHTTPGMESMVINLDHEGGEKQIHRGTFPCGSGE